MSHSLLLHCLQFMAGIFVVCLAARKFHFQRFACNMFVAWYGSMYEVLLWLTQLLLYEVGKNVVSKRISSRQVIGVKWVKHTQYHHALEVCVGHDIIIQWQI